MGQTLLSNVAPRSMEIAQVTWKLTNNQGMHSIFVLVDSTNNVTEVDETNNTTYITINVSGNTDLIASVKSIDISKFPEINLTTQISKLSGEPVFGLVNGNFSLTEEGKEVDLQLKSASTGEYQKPKVDIQFVIDTSGSMDDEWRDINSLLGSLTQSIEELGIDLDYSLLTLGQNLTQGIYNGQTIYAGQEDWGPGTAWVARNHSWREGAVRIIIPISDENAYRGGGSSTWEDLISVSEAGDIAKENNVTVYPFYGDGSHRHVIINMESLAAATGGQVFYFADTTGVTNDLKNIIVKAASTYNLSFISPNPVYNGNQRSLKVDISHNGTSGTTSTSYWAPYIMLPDLIFDQNLYIEKEWIETGDITTLRATVGNHGGAAVENIKIGFYQIDKLNSETKIRDINIGRLNPGETQTVGFSWAARTGVVKIKAILDPYNEVQEIDENNNTSEAKVNVYKTELPDLAILPVNITYSPVHPLIGDNIVIQANIENTGLSASGVAVEFYAGDPANGGKRIGDRQIIDYISSDSMRQVSVTWKAPVTSIQDVYVLVDPDDQLAEYRETNNSAKIEIVFEEPSLVMGLLTEKEEYQAFSDLGIQLSAVNTGNGTLDGVLQVEIKDTQGNRIELIDNLTVTNLTSQQVCTATSTWNTKDTMAGDYVITATFIRLGKPVKQVSRTFIILPDKSIDVNFTSDKAAYDANQYVNLASEVTSQSKNYLFKNLEQEVIITKENGEEIVRNKTILGGFLRGQTKANTWSWFTDVYEPGVYTAALVTTEDGTVIGERKIEFEILSSLETGNAVKGQITGISDEVILGGGFQVSYQIENIGNVNLDVPVEILIVKPETEKVVETIINTVELNIKADKVMELTKEKLLIPAENSYAVILMVEISGKKIRLDSSGLKVLPPEASFSSGMQYKPGVLVWSDDEINQQLVTDALEDKDAFYKIVTDNDKFIEELGTNMYRTYLVLDPQHPLTDHQDIDLLDKIQNGEGIFATNDANKGGMRVSELFGMDFRGSLPPGEQSVVFIDSDITESKEQMFYGKFQKPEGTTAQVIATTAVNGDEYPVILLNTYGEGRAVFLTFDPAETVSHFVYGETVTNSVYGQQIIGLYKNGIDYLRPVDKDAFEKYDVLAVTTKLYNSGPATQLRLQTLLPQGVTPIEYDNALIEENKLTWDINLNEDQTKTIKLVFQISEDMEQDGLIKNLLYYLNVDTYKELSSNDILIPEKQQSMEESSDVEGSLNYEQ